WSRTNWFGDDTGVLKSSLKGREVDWNKPGVVVKGLDINTCGAGSRATADGQYLCVGGTANATNVTAENYFQDIFPVNEGYVYNDTYVKLRELRVGFDLPTHWANAAHASAVNLALTGRNLHTWTKVPIRKCHTAPVTEHRAWSMDRFRMHARSGSACASHPEPFHDYRDIHIHPNRSHAESTLSACRECGDRACRRYRLQQ